VQDVTRANGTVTTYGYDAADRVRDVRTTLNTVTLSQFQYTVDRVGHRTAVTEAVGGQSRTISYSYDGLERLTHATEQGGTAYRYAYDAVGNRTDVWTNDTLQEHRDYDAANQVVGWQYDQAGNLLGDGQTSYTYDPLNRLATTTRGSATTTNTYNGDGVLIAQESGGTTTRYVQDLQAPLPQVLATTQGSATTRYVYGLDRLASVSGTTRTWEVHDALGSARQTLGNNGQPTSTLRYDAWGMPVDNTQPAPFGFTGEFQDAMSGLVYLRARWYNPSTGTFLQRDPFEGFDTQPYSLHPYQYAYSNPVLYTDPSGQCVDAAGRAVPCAGSEPQPADAARSAADHVGRSLDTTAALRYAYQEGEAGIAVVVQRMQAEGKSEAEIARWAVNARNTLRQTIRDQGEPIIEFIAQRARGARDMPTYDYLRDVREKTDAQIIASASRSNPGADLWAGRLRVAGRIIIGIDIGIAGYRVATAGVDWPQVLIHETGRIGGALAGGWAGAKLGAAGGGAAGAAAGGIGAVPGAAAGSIICGLGGAVVGGWAGGEVADWTIEQLFPPDQTRFEAR
jgi:RHS repeat-associated protein